MIKRKILFTHRAEKDLTKLDPAIRTRIVQALRDFEKGIKEAIPLTGEFMGFHKLRVGTYRVILERSSVDTFIIRFIMHRRNVYIRK